MVKLIFLMIPSSFHGQVVRQSLHCFLQWPQNDVAANRKLSNVFKKENLFDLAYPDTRFAIGNKMVFNFSAKFNSIVRTFSCERTHFRFIDIFDNYKRFSLHLKVFKEKKLYMMVFFSRKTQTFLPFCDPELSIIES